METASASVRVCGRVSVCPVGFQCAKLCGDCMPYIKTNESNGSLFSSSFFYISTVFVVDTVKSEFIKFYFVVE